MEKVVEKKRYRLSFRDILIGLLIAVLTPVLVVIQQTVESGELNFDLKTLAMAGISGGLAYLLKNFFEPGKTIVIKDQK